MGLPDWFHEAAARVNNWGRWGADDRIGTLNFITPEVVARAARCVRTGRRFSLAWPLSFAQDLQRGNIPGRSILRTMTTIDEAMLGDRSLFCTSDDVVTMGLQVATHWDGLGHVSYDGRLYNGVPTSTITAQGATELGIHHVQSLVGRGVLLDVARAKGVERLEPSYAVVPGDLDEASAAAGVTVDSGDVVLIRTGQMSYLRGRRPDRDGYAMTSSGISWRCAEWFHTHEVAAVAVDNLTFDAYPPSESDAFFPAHLLHLVEMGLTQGQNWDLDALADDCAVDGVATFLLEASPLPFTNAVGSPVNPVAIK
ncbi:MAG TPA: cyclase family protein [Acidimicrobiales bacterium]|nr:cyclase family protein [Acidimicrobiales bacterium]